MRFVSLGLGLVCLAASGTGCSDRLGNATGSGGDGSGAGHTSSTSSTTPGTGGGDTGSGGGTPSALCEVTLSHQPETGAGNVRVAGEWNGFDLASATAFQGPNEEGLFTATLKLPPGLHGYKVIYEKDGQTIWSLDASQGRRKYVGGIENSAVLVRDCHLPDLTVKNHETQRPAAGQGSFSATLSYVDGADGTGPDPAGFEATLFDEFETRPLTDAEMTVDAAGGATLNVKGLADGKYKIEVRAKTKSGVASAAKKLVFWVEAEAFSWNDAIVYMVMTDRYRDGTPGNNAPPTPGADPRGDFKGGDLEGLRQSIAAGELDKLGVRAIWLSPFQTNPSTAYPASDGVHMVTGYHGYWPIKAREVDPRLGGPDALRAVVKEAHKHGIRILQDYVVNHVHQEHEYVAAHPDWFHTVDNGCVCGTAGCDWTEKALTCLFAPYMPDINHTVPEANAQLVDDALFWLDDMGLDGLRVDAVKHVEEVATRNLSVAVRETFETAGARYFLMGETAMGWSDGMTCASNDYQTIARYIGPYGLDGQFDFVLYHGVSYRTFAWGEKGYLHADYWTQQGISCWPKDAVMTRYIGSHDTSRFTSMADYRGQNGAKDKGIPGNQWDNTAVAPTDPEPYWRTRVAFAWLLTLPGAPLLYYGDEYGQWGGADPNNRLMWRPEAELTANEKATLDFVRKVGQARKTNVALRRGAYVPLMATDDVLVFGRKTPAGEAAIVAITSSAAPKTVTVDGAQLGLSPAAPLHDAIGGPDVTPSGVGKITFTIPGQSAVILAP